MSAQHTPGPWVVRNGNEIFCGRKRVCHVNAASKGALNMFDDRMVAEANARLIAASTDLLEALQELDAKPEHTSSWLKARAAIAKATGETK